MKPGTYSIILVFAWAIAVSAFGQISIEGYRVPIKTDVIEISKDTIEIEQVLESHSSWFYSTDSLQRAKDGYTYWFRLDFGQHIEKLAETDTVFIVTGLVDDCDVYVRAGNGTIGSKHYSFVTSKNYHGSNATILTIPVVVNTFVEGRYVFMKRKFYRGAPNLGGVFYRYNDSTAELFSQDFVSVNNVEGQVQVFLFFGVAGLLLIFNILLYFSNREQQYLYYGFFLICQMIYYTRGSPVLTNALFRDYHYLHYVLTEVTQVGASLGYLMFVRYFLETKRTLPLLDWAIRIVATGLFLFIVIDSIFLALDPYFASQVELMNAERYFMATFAVVGVGYLAIKGKPYLPYFIIAGTVFYTGGALMTMFLLKLSYMITGSALESMIFALGISYKIRSIREERLKYEREVNQVTLSALRAQMNPHFIFNSLNSIQHLISKNDRVNALKYLTKFSTLLRQILESSVSVNVPISREIELLKIYLQLESFRFDHSFEYSIDVDESLDVHNLELPIMLLQPYVENSIAHGLLPKLDGEKRLTISVKNNDRFVVCTIADTGIGRKAAMERKKTLNVDRPSRGMDITKKRLALINKNMNADDLVQITDSDQGTVVEIRIPKN